MNTRTQAAELLSMLATQPDSWPWLTTDAPGNWSPDARRMANDVLSEIIDAKANPAWRAVYAEASARLRSAES